MNYFKAAEQVLLSVRALEQSIENLERREKRSRQGGYKKSLYRYALCQRNLKRGFRADGV